MREVLPSRIGQVLAPREVHVPELRAPRKVLCGLVCQILAAGKIHLLELRARRKVLRSRVRQVHTWGICNNNLYTESGQTLQGSFSAVSKQASKVVQSFSMKFCK